MKCNSASSIRDEFVKIYNKRWTKAAEYPIAFVIQLVGIWLKYMYCTLEAAPGVAYFVLVIVNSPIDNCLD